jgi:spectinomycin phosphotransferase
VYPFIEHRTGMAQGMSDAQWIEYGAILRQIHGAAIPPDLERRLRRETFRPDGAAAIRRLDAHLAAGAFADDAESQALAAFWHDQRDLIHTVLERAEDLGQRLTQKSPSLVLCHADIHTNNVLLDTDERVWVTDWDETMLAPRERDLMFVTDGGIHRWVVGPREEALTLQGYGEADIDPLALAYYRSAWATSDIGSYGESVCFLSNLGPATRRESVDRFKSLFVPGSIVPLALASDEHRSGATR